MVISIGVNNFNYDSAGEIAAGILTIAKWTQQNMPSTKIILTGPLPTGLEKGTDRRKKYETIHQALIAYKDPSWYYLPLTDTFIMKDGNIDPSTYAKDGIHLVTNGYRQWALTLKPVIDKLIRQR